jgi:hypothetical protein
MEQWIKEGKLALHWTRLSCRAFRDNAVRLQLFALAYNLANFLRSLARRDPAPDRPLARAARCGGLTRADAGAAGAEGRTVCRNRPEGPKQPGPAPGPRFSSSSQPRSSGEPVLELTGDRPRSRVSGVDRAHLGNIGWYLTENRRRSRILSDSRTHLGKVGLSSVRRVGRVARASCPHLRAKDESGGIMTTRSLAVASAILISISGSAVALSEYTAPIWGYGSYLACTVVNYSTTAVNITIKNCVDGNCSTSYQTAYPTGGMTETFA